MNTNLSIIRSLHPFSPKQLFYLLYHLKKQGKIDTVVIPKMDRSYEQKNIIFSVIYIYYRYVLYMYIHACMHTYIHIYIHPYIHTCMHACIHPYIHTYIHTYMRVYIYIYIYTHTHILRGVLRTPAFDVDTGPFPPSHF